MFTSRITTTDHERIKQWARERNATPRVLASEGVGAEHLSFNFGEPDTEATEITWDEFFTIFEDNQLAFQYDEKNNNDTQSRFFHFIIR